jgi:hypothetical protein
VRVREQGLELEREQVLEQEQEQVLELGLVRHKQPSTHLPVPLP